MTTSTKTVPFDDIFALIVHIDHDHCKYGDHQRDPLFNNLRRVEDWLLARRAEMREARHRRITRRRTRPMITHTEVK
jgi:hypothetical protein